MKRQSFDDVFGWVLLFALLAFNLPRFFVGSVESSERLGARSSTVASDSDTYGAKIDPLLRCVNFTLDASLTENSVESYIPPRRSSVSRRVFGKNARSFNAGGRQAQLAGAVRFASAARRVYCQRNFLSRQTLKTALYLYLLTLRN